MAEQRENNSLKNNEINKYYDSTFVCTYNILDDEDLYRAQFLDAFKLEIWDDERISNTTDLLYDIVKNELKVVLDKIRIEPNKCKFSHLLLFMGENLTNENIFRVFFVYDLFHITHKCICECIKNKKITDKTKEEIYKSLF